MDDVLEQYLPPTAPEPKPEPSRIGPGDDLDTTTGATVAVAIGSFLAVLVLFLLGQVIQLMNLPVGLTVTSLAIFGGAGLFFPSLFNLKPLRFTGLARDPGLLSLFAILIGIANLPFANTLMAVMMQLLPESWGAEAKETTKLLLHADQLSRGLIVIAAGLAAPVGEELFFRGWLQPLLSRRLGTTIAVVTVAIAFSAIHFDPVGFVARVELGVLFGLARAWSGSLWPAIALHATHNLVSTAALYFAPDEQAQIEPKLSWTDAPAALISLVVAVALLRAFHRAALRRLVPEPELVPLRFTFGRALVFGSVNFAVLALSTASIAIFRDRLPGTELTQPIWNKVFKVAPSAPANVPNPEDRRGHLK